MFQRAKILSYNSINRTAQVNILGLTDGAESGLTATFAYPVGDDDRDTERQIVDGNDVYVFFEGGDQARPVIAFYSSHGMGNIQDIRRIRQQNIELLAKQNIKLQAQEIYLMGHVTIEGDITHHGSQSTSGTLTAQDDVIGGGKSLKTHRHGGVKGGSDSTSQPQ